MGLFGVELFGSEMDRINNKIQKLQAKRDKITADPFHSKDDLVTIDMQLNELEAKYAELAKQHKK